MARSRTGFVPAMGLAAMVLWSGMARADELHVLVSGAFTGAFRTLAPRFEQQSGHKLALSWGPSFGTTHEALPVRIANGEPTDVLLIVDTSLDKLVAQGRFAVGSRTDVAVSRIGVGVKAGTPKPDVGTVDAVRQTLLNAASVGFSEGASGVFVSKDLLDKLGIADRMAGKMRKITGELVGDAIARGEVQIGLQQVSEMLSVKGVDLVGPLPDAIQKASVMTAAIAANSKEQQAARDFVAFLATPEARQALAKSGLDPVTSPATKP
jgi:molybdate transport system substrate-binding protein